MSGNGNRELVQKVVAGDREQFEYWLLAHYEELRIAIRAKMPTWLNDALEPEDLLQETMISAFQKIGQFRGTTEKSLFTWLKAISENKLREAIRFNTRKKRGGGRARRVRTIPDGRSNSGVQLVEVFSGGEDSPSLNMARNEVQIAIELGIATLPEEQREAINLRYIQGLSLEKTAATMDVSPGAVRGLLQRGKAHLKLELENSSRWF